MERAKAGFVYTVEAIKDGVVVDREEVHNLIPTEGINHLIEVGLKGATQVTSWNVGIFESNYTPDASDTMATLPGAANESTAYTELTRRPLVLGAVSGGSADNSASRAEFTGSTNGKTIYGGFIASSSTKGATVGTLLSVVKFATPKSFDAGTILRVTAGLQITSA